MGNGASVSGKLLFQGKLLLKTPLLIGSGEKNEYVDTVTLKDANGNPYIPATSLTGALRHHFTEYASKIGKVERIFWGGSTPDRDSVQSALFIRDLTTKEPATIVVRDGVRLSSLGVAIDEMKYDYEVVEPGISFDLYMEVTLRNQFDKKAFKRIFVYLVQVLASGEFSLGAMTTKGLGSVVLAEGHDCREYDFSRKEDVTAWLASDFTAGERIQIPSEWTYAPKRHDLVVQVDVAIANSLIIREYRPVGDADAVHLFSNGNPVIPGTSLKGALKSRAKRIVRTLNGEISLLDDLFGPDPKQRREVNKGDKTAEKQEDEDLVRSRVLVNEATIQNYTEKDQTRVRIDRFTGGAVDHALFTTRPLWPKNSDSKMATIKVAVKGYREWEAGLILLLLKDLWTADLPIGGEKSIGRGAFYGKRATIGFGDKTVEIAENNGKLTISGGSPEGLQAYVNALVTRCSRKEATDEDHSSR